MAYIPTADSNIVLKEITESTEINMTDIVTEYVELKAALTALPTAKTEPDQETLQYWTDFFLPELEINRQTLNDRARVLYEEVKPIVDAGLFPSEYESQFVELENYVNSL